MAKAVFRHGEIALGSSKVFLDAPFPEIKPQEVTTIENSNIEDIFDGPTADDLREEAEEFKFQWESEKALMISSAKKEADIIISDARFEAESSKTQADEYVEAKKVEAEEESKRLYAEAEAKAASIVDGAQARADETKTASYNEGFAKGREDGYENGKAEVQRLIVRTQVILERIQDKRADILAEAEQQIIDMVLLVARKVIKTISETQRNVVVENIKEALGKVKTRGNLTIKVNLQDLELSTSHLQDFIKLVEGGGNIQILEDSSVDMGGCVVETDFGEIDARIANQFLELEARILSLSPIKSKS